MDLFRARDIPKCFAAILGIGNLRLQRLMGGQVDRRFKVWGGAPRIHSRWHVVHLAWCRDIEHILEHICETLLKQRHNIEQHLKL